MGQATEASSRGSRRRCQGLLLQGTLRLATLRLQCLRSPGWDGKITQGRSQKSKPHKKSTERRMGEHRRLLAGKRSAKPQPASSMLHFEAKIHRAIAGNA